MKDQVGSHQILTVITLLMQDYLERPAYQQNDYIGWINQAKQKATKQKRLNQMLAELKQGGVYMKMAHPASAKR